MAYAAANNKAIREEGEAEVIKRNKERGDSVGKAIVFLFNDAENELIPKLLDLAGAQQFEAQFITLPLRLSFEGLEIRMVHKQVLFWVNVKHSSIGR